MEKIEELIYDFELFWNAIEGPDWLLQARDHMINQELKWDVINVALVLLANQQIVYTARMYDGKQHVQGFPITPGDECGSVR